MAKDVYDVLDIARYVINHYNKKSVEISNLKLQKLIYYVQAAFLVERDKACFDEPIVNWSYGPVVEIVYREYRGFGYGNIPMQNQYEKIIFESKSEKIKYVTSKFDENIIKKSDAELIIKSIESYLKYTSFELVKKTHEEAPWLESKNNDQITQESIKTYYKANKEKLYGEGN